MDSMERQMAQMDVAMRGKLIDLMTAEEETVKEEWQTKSLENHIQEAGLRKRGFTMPLASDLTDITKEPRAIELVKDFVPDVELSGWELRAERKSKAWGGVYFRVLEQSKEGEEDKAVIQWIYVWTKQRFFISLWITVLPLFLLAIIGTLIFSFLSLGPAAISVALIGGILFLLGVSQLFTAIKGMIKGAFYFSNQQLFLLFGAMFWLLLAEIYFSKGSQAEEILDEAKVFHQLPGHEVIDPIIADELTLSLSWVAVIFFFAGIIALILWKWEPPSFTHATHDMDWAPLFIYLQKEENKWKLDKVRYDAFHYYTGCLTRNELLQKRAIGANLKRIRFEIPNFWHSFQIRSGFSDWFSVLFGFLIFLISVLVGIISFIASSPDTLLGSDIVRFVVFPILLFIGVYLIFSKWPTKVFDTKKIDLSDEKYHLTENRLRIFWNLRGQEPALKVRSKLQDPFIEDEDFSTFRDDLEQIVFYSLLPRLMELEQKEFFNIL